MCQPHRQAFTIIELIITITIMLVLVSLVIPMLRGGMTAAERMKCMEQLHEIGYVTRDYVASNSGIFPPLVFSFNPGKSKNIVVLVKPRKAATSGLALYDEDSLVCPSDDEPGTLPVNLDYGTIEKRPNSYAFNIDIIVRNRRHTALQTLSKTAIFFDGSMSGSGGGGKNIQGAYKDGFKFAEKALTLRHNATAEVLFADWHVENIKALTRSMILGD